MRRILGWARGAVLGACAGALLITAGATAAAATPSGSPAVTELAGQLVVASGQVYKGSVSMVAGSVEVDGTLQGNVDLAAGRVSVGPAGEIDGSVQIGAGLVQVAPGGSIMGTVQVGGSSRQTLICAPSAAAGCSLAGPAGAPRPVAIVGHRVPGTILRRLLGLRGPTGFASFFAGLHVLTWIGLLALALPVAAIWPGPIAEVQRQVTLRTGASALIGLLALLLAAPVLVVVALTIVGIPVALAAVLGLAAAWFFGYVAVAGLIGASTAALARGGASPAPLWALVLGTALLAAIGWIPFLGGLVSLAVACVGLGAVLLTRFGTGRRWLPPRAALIAPLPEPPADQGGSGQP